MGFNRRILIVDDNKSIHEDFRKVLCPAVNQFDSELDELEKDLFSEDDAAEESKPSLTVEDVSIEYEVDSAYQGQEALELVRNAEQQDWPYALIFMDVRMPPGWDGIETISRIWVEFPFVEMVICTAYSDYTWDDIVKKLGCTDKLLFLTKPFEAITVKQMALTLIKKWNLGQQARSYVANLEREVQDRTKQLQELLLEVERKNQELLNANKKLEQVALHDDLTGLPNRALFNDRLQHNVQVAARDNHSFAVLLLDVDNFKQINDTHGHHAGDVVLQAVGSRLADVLRNSDTVARLGGDEFAIILHALDSDTAEQVSKKALKAIEPPVLVDPSGTSVVVSVSIGIAMFPVHGEKGDTLLMHADKAMYIAKEAGIGYTLYDSPHEDERTGKLKLIADLQEALVNENSGFQLHYQPIVDFYTNAVCGVEALSRWTHPTRGNVPPFEFIPLAEQKGLIQLLTLRVLKIAIAQCAAWHTQGIHIGVSINLSTRNFLDPVISIELQKLINVYQVNPRFIKLEITESMTISNPEKALQVIKGLKDIGIEISIDDFGTGYSSLAYLKKLPVNELKIDRMFVSDMNSDKGTYAIVKSTIDLAHTLGLFVVGEGIEDQETLNTLIELGCDKAQGYFICKPQASDVITQWLQESAWKAKRSA